MTMLEKVIREAAHAFDPTDRLFSTANFQSALSRLTQATPMITPQAAEAILTSLPYVRRDSRCFWYYNLIK